MDGAAVGGKECHVRKNTLGTPALLPDFILDPSQCRCAVYAVCPLSRLRVWQQQRPGRRRHVGSAGLPHIQHLTHHGLTSECMACNSHGCSLTRSLHIWPYLGTKQERGTKQAQRAGGVV